MVNIVRICKTLFFSFFVLVALVISQVFAQDSCSRYPSCAEGDTKMLLVTSAGPPNGPPANAGFNSLSGEPIRLELIADGSQGQLEFGIFDPDDTSTWDFGDNNSLFTRFSIYADPDRTSNSTGLFKVLEFSSDDVDVADCPASVIAIPPATYSPGDPASLCNDAWKDFAIDHSEHAFDGENYNYLLEAEYVGDEEELYLNGFKVRVLGDIFLQPGGKISIIGNQNSTDQTATPIVFPQTLSCDLTMLPGSIDFSTCDCVDNMDSTPCFLDDEPSYDGNFSLDVLFEPDQDEIITELVIWDGDFDFGDGDFSGQLDDTDDPDTPNAIPTINTSPHAIAEGLSPIGVPPDNDPSPIFARGGPVMYELVSPNGTIFSNTDISGSREWERFSIRRNDHPEGCNPTLADICVDSIPSGVWRINIAGMDLGNMNFLAAEFSTMSVAPVPTLTRWGMMILIVLFGMAILLTLRTRRA